MLVQVQIGLLNNFGFGTIDLTVWHAKVVSCDKILTIPAAAAEYHWWIESGGKLALLQTMTRHVDGVTRQASSLIVFIYKFLITGPNIKWLVLFAVWPLKFIFLPWEKWTYCDKTTVVAIGSLLWIHYWNPSLIYCGWVQLAAIPVLRLYCLYLERLFWQT